MTDFLFTFPPAAWLSLRCDSNLAFCILPWVRRVCASAPSSCLLADADGEAFASAAMLADLWAQVLQPAVPLAGTGHVLEMAWQSAPLAFSAGELRQPATRWLRQMLLSLTLGHLALLSHTQRVMPGNLPDATRNQPGPREYCQVVLASRSLGAQWLPATRAGLRAQSAVGGTHSLQHLSAFHGCHRYSYVLCFEPFCLHVAFASLCNCGNRKGSLDRSHGFYGCVCSEILVGKHVAPRVLWCNPYDWSHLNKKQEINLCQSARMTYIHFG